MLEDYSNASGSAMAENEVRMGSWETKINQLRNAINNFWNNTIDTGLVKSMIGGITLLINNFGNLRTILGLVFTLLAVNKGAVFLKFLKDFSLSTILLNSSLVQTQARLAGMSFAQIGLMGTTTALNFAIKGLWATMLANPIGLVVGAVTAVIVAFDFMGARAERSAQKQKEVFDELNRSINSLKQQTSEAKNLASQYESLSAISSRTINEETKLEEIRSRLITQFPDLIDGYDAEGKAILGSSESIQQAIKDNEELLKVKQEQMAITFTTDGKNDFSQLQKDQERLDLLIKHKDEYLKTIEDINSGSQNKIDEYGNNSLEIAKNNLKGIKDELSTLSAKVLESRKDLSILAEAFLQSSDSAKSLGKEAVTKLIYDLSKLKDESKITGEEFTKIFDGLKSSDFSSELNKAKIVLEELAKSGANKDIIGNTYEKAISDMSPYLIALGISAEETNKILKDMFNIPNVQLAKEKINDFSSSLTTLQKTLSDASSSISEIQTALKEYNDNGKFNIDTIIKLSEKHKELIPLLGDEKGLHQELTNIIHQEQEASRQAYANMLMDSAEYYQKNIEGVNSLVKGLNLGYNKDLENFKSLADAKFKVDQALIQKLASEWSNFYKAGKLVAQPLDAGRTLVDANGRASGNGYGISPEMKANTDGLKDYINQMSAFSSALDDIAMKGTSSIDFSGIGMSGGKEKEKKPQEPSYTDPIQAIINEINLESKLTAEKNKAIQADLDLATSNKNYSLQLQKTTELLKGQTDEINQLQQANYKLMSEGDKVGAWNYIDENGEATKQYYDTFNSSSAEAQKLMQDELSKLSTIKKAINENTQAILDTRSAQVKLNQSLQEFQNSQADEAISALKEFYQNQKELDDKAYQEKVDKLEKSHQKILDNLEKEEKAAEESINAQIEAIDRLADAQNYNKNLNTAQSERQDIQNQINAIQNDTSPEGRARLAELQKQIAEKNSSIEDMQQTHTNDLRKQNLQDSLEAIKKNLEAEKEAENSIYNAKKERMEAEKQLAEDNYNARMADETYWADLRKAILEGNITDINDALTNFSDGFTKDLTEKAKEIDSAFKNIISTINEIKSASSSIPQYASGTPNHPGGLAKTSEKGSELIIPPNRPPFLSGNNGPEIMNLEKGTKILPHNETEALLNKSTPSTLSSIPSYADGVGVSDILKNISLSSLLQTIPSLISLPSFSTPQFTPNNTSSSSNITIPNMNFNVNATDGKIPNSELERAAKYTVKYIEKLQIIRGRN